MLIYVIAIFVAGGIVAIDQYTKLLALQNLANGVSKPFIKGFIEFLLCKNSGGAWGMMSGYTWLLVSITLVVMIVVIALLLKFGSNNKLLFWAATFVLGGGIGNMIDRVFRGGEVIDFLHFEFWKSFPIFNIADCAVVLGAGLLILYFIAETLKDSREKTSKIKENNSQNEEN